MRVKHKETHHQKNYYVFRRYPEFKVWSKQRGIVIQPTNFRKRARQFAREFNEINPGDPRIINFNPEVILRG